MLTTPASRATHRNNLDKKEAHIFVMKLHVCVAWEEKEERLGRLNMFKLSHMGLSLDLINMSRNALIDEKIRTHFLVIRHA